MRILLVIDLGTTLFKFTLVDQAGRIVALARHPTPLTRPAPGQCELTIPDFEQAIVQGSQALRTQAPAAWNGIEAVTFASQANTVALFDDRDRPLTPFLVWTDTRATAHPEIRAQLAEWPAPHCRTGLPALAPTMAVAKLMWWRAQAPAIWNRTRRAAFLSDYLTAWLTGQWLCAGGIAGLTACCDIATLTWIPETLAVFGWTPEYFSVPVRGGALAGPVRAPVAARLGLPPGCRCVVGELDQYAGALGVGNLERGGISETTGTVLAVVQCATADTSVTDGVIQGPGPTADLAYRMTFSQVSANWLDWQAARAQPPVTIPELVTAAEAVPAGANGLTFVPPEQADALPRFEGTLPADPVLATTCETRAILERIAQELQNLLRTLTPDPPHGPIRAAGGGARSDLLLRIKARTLGLPIMAMACPEPTSQGAALAAAVTLDWGNQRELAAAWIQPRAVFNP